MLKEAIQELVQLGKKSQTVAAIPHPETSHKSILVHTDGEIEVCEHAPPFRKHFVTDMKSLKIAMDAYALLKGTAIWVAFHQVVAVLDDNDYRDNTVTLRLTESPIFKAIQTFGDPGGKVSDPKKLYRFLKHDCNGASITPADLDLAISNLKFRTEDELSREVSKTADKMGQSIRSEVSGADKIPDIVTFEFLPWPSIEEEYQSLVQVPCQLYIDPAERSISLKPLPGMIDFAKSGATAELAQYIATKWKLEGVPVLCGTP